MATKSSQVPTEAKYATELRNLVKLAQAGNATALPRIREILRDNPEIWQQVGDLTGYAERAWIAVLSANHPLAAESMKQTIEAMRADLAGEHPTRLESLLVDQIITCWMQVKHAETVSASRVNEAESLGQAKFWLRNVESATKRYMNALSTLAKVRALMPAGLAPSGTIRAFAGSSQQRA